MQEAIFQECLSADFRETNRHHELLTIHCRSKRAPRTQRGPKVNGRWTRPPAGPGAGEAEEGRRSYSRDRSPSVEHARWPAKPVHGQALSHTFRLLELSCREKPEATGPPEYYIERRRRRVNRAITQDGAAAIPESVSPRKRTATLVDPWATGEGWSSPRAPPSRDTRLSLKIGARDGRHDGNVR